MTGRGACDISLCPSALSPLPPCNHPSLLSFAVSHTRARALSRTQAHTHTHKRSERSHLWRGRGDRLRDRQLCRGILALFRIIGPLPAIRRCLDRLDAQPAVQAADGNERARGDRLSSLLGRASRLPWNPCRRFPARLRKPLQGPARGTRPQIRGTARCVRLGLGRKARGLDVISSKPLQSSEKIGSWRSWAPPRRTLGDQAGSRNSGLHSKNLVSN